MSTYALKSRFWNLVNILVIISMLGQALLPAVVFAAPPVQAPTNAPVAPPPSAPPVDPTPPPLRATDTSTTTIYLPLVMRNAGGQPVGQEITLEPGIGGILEADDAHVRAEFTTISVTQTTIAAYQPISRPTDIPAQMGVGGAAFSITAYRAADHTPVTYFPFQTKIFTDVSPWYSVYTPSITLTVRYTDTDTAGLDMSVFSLYRRNATSGDWEKVPTAVYQSQHLMVAEIEHIGEFVPMSRLAIYAPRGTNTAGVPRSVHITDTPADAKKLVLDPDDDDGHAYWPGYGTQRELTYNVRLAQEVKSRLENDKCRADILLTRDVAVPGKLNRNVRADMARTFGADTFVTLAFNTCGDACAADPFWGSQVDGGSLVWSGGDADDVALGNQLLNHIAVLSRPHKWGYPHPVLPYSQFVALDATYAHLETLYLDHNFDRRIIQDDANGFPAIADAVYAGVRAQLEAEGMTCGDDPNNPPPYPDPPSAEMLKRWADLGYQSMQTYGTGYEILRMRRAAQQYGGDPASFSTGNHIQQIHLGRIPGRGGLDFNFTLFYNSQDNRDDLFGYGWSFPYNARAQKYSDDSVNVTLSDGRTYYYTPNGSGYDAPAGVHETLSDTAAGWQWETLDGTTLAFSQTVAGFGILTDWTDRRGNRLHFEYDLSGQNNWQDGEDVPRPPLTRITDDAGRAVSFTTDADSHITGMSLFDGRSFSFGYTDGNLTAVTDAKGNTHRFEYDARHRITKEWDAAGIFFLQNIYDDRDRVIEQVDANGTHSYFAYDPVNRVTTFTDNLGNQSKYFYDDLNRITAEEDALGNRTVYAYDADYNLIATTDPRGNTTRYEYDARGNMTKRIEPVDTYSLYDEDVSTFEYNVHNDLIKTTDALGNVTTFDYDAAGNLLAIHQPGGRDTTFTYNSWGQPLTMTDPNGHTTTYTYDTYGNLLTTTDAEGNTSTSTYDAAGRETSYTDANSHTVTFEYDANNNITRITDPNGAHTDFVYDANDLLTQSTDRLGKITRYEYDNNLKLITETDPAGYRVEYGYDLMYNRTVMTDARGNATHYAYDAGYHLTAVTDANGRVTRYEYDPNGNLSAVIDAQGNRTRMIYDAVNRLKYQIDPLGGRNEYCYDAEDRLIRFFNPNRAETRYEYDGVGNLVRQIDPLGNVQTFEYDPAGNLLKLTDPNQHSTEYVYDRIDRLTRQIDPLGNSVDTAYDGVGNVLTVTDPRGNTTTFGYDANDNAVTITDPLSNHINYAYDAEDRQIAVIDQHNNTTAFGYDARGLMISITEPGDYQTRFAYDGNGNLIAKTDANSQTTVYQYDPVNLLLQETDPLSHETVYHYDTLNRLTTVTDANDVSTGYVYDANDHLIAVQDAISGTTAYAYDPAGNLIRITDANSNTTRFAYNMRDELVKETNPLSATWEYHYDGAGNLTMRRDANWNPTHYGYDAANRLSEIRYPAVVGTSGVSVTFAYDAAGNEIAMHDWNGVITHTYDALNRRVHTTNFNGATIAYAYDEASNLTGLTYPNEQTVTYGYDARNQLAALTDPAHRTINYTYNPLGALSHIARPNHTATDYAYDAANRLTAITHKQNGTIFSGYGYVLDAVGNRVQTNEARRFSGNGNVPVYVTSAKNYAYDALYRLTGVEATSAVQGSAQLPTQDVGYTFDAVGNRLEQTGIPQAVDPTNAVEPIRPAPPISNTYTYNDANQLTAVSGQSSVVSFGYDDNGNRVSETEVLTDGTSLLTTYAWDYENRLVGVTKAVSDSVALTVTMVATYTYDGYGRRVKKEVADYQSPITNSTVITYLYNGLDPIADYETAVVSNTAVSTATHYYWANGGIAEIERLPNADSGFAGDVHWTHTDGLGSLVDLTDTNGDTAAVVYYDEYGQLLTEFESLSRFSYTGQEFDAETGLYHFYARYYDPSVGVWLSQDTYRGRLVDPLSLHRYGYVGGRPINRVDVLGYKGSNPFAGQQGICGVNMSCEPKKPKKKNPFLEALSDNGKNRDKVGCGYTMSCDPVLVRNKVMRNIFSQAPSGCGVSMSCESEYYPQQYHNDFNTISNGFTGFGIGTRQQTVLFYSNRLGGGNNWYQFKSYSPSNHTLYGIVDPTKSGKGKNLFKFDQPGYGNSGYHYSSRGPVLGRKTEIPVSYKIGRTTKAVKYLGRITFALGVAADSYNLYNSYQYSQQTGDYSVLKQEVAGTAGSYVGAIAGAEAGASLGATIGTFITPGPGTVVGGVVGGVIGGVAGSIGGDWIGRKIGGLF